MYNPIRLSDSGRIIITPGLSKIQQPVYESKARFKIIAAGIRSGKNYCCNYKFVIHLMICAYENKSSANVTPIVGWIIAPTEEIAWQEWSEINQIIPKHYISDQNRSEKQITLINGVVIKVYSAYSAKSFMDIDLPDPVPLDAVLITEAARIKELERIWKYTRECLDYRQKSEHSSNKGIALVNSTPNGKNYFYKMFCMGNKNNPAYDPDFESFHWTTWDNPYMAAKGNEFMLNGMTYKDNLKCKMGEKRYLQDIMGEFID